MSDHIPLSVKVMPESNKVTRPATVREVLHLPDTSCLSTKKNTVDANII